MDEMKQKVIEQVDEKIDMIIQEGINPDNLDALGKLIDIHKDLSNEEYWKKKEEGIQMRYRDYDDRYDNYGRGRRRDSRGRYEERNPYRRHEGEEMLDDMHMMYREYSTGREEYNRGNYGAKSDTMKSLDCMLESIVDFVEALKENAGSQEEVELIKKYTKEISEI